MRRAVTCRSVRAARIGVNLETNVRNALEPSHEL